MSRKLTQYRGVDELSARMQGENARVLDTVNAPGSIGAGRIISVALTTATQEVAHGLGRKWTGAIVVGADAAVSLITSGASDDRSFIGVRGDAAANVSLWVF